MSDILGYAIFRDGELVADTLGLTRPAPVQPVKLSNSGNSVKSSIDTIKLAKKAGIEFQGGFVRVAECVIQSELETFAELVRAEALQEAAKVCDGIQEIWLGEPVSDRPGWDCAAAIRGLK